MIRSSVFKRSSESIKIKSDALVYISSLRSIRMKCTQLKASVCQTLSLKQILSWSQEHTTWWIQIHSEYRRHRLLQKKRLVRRWQPASLHLLSIHHRPLAKPMLEEVSSVHLGQVRSFFSNKKAVQFRLPQHPTVSRDNNKTVQSRLPLHPTVSRDSNKTDQSRLLLHPMVSRGQISVRN